jgi:hypothetical protein
VEQQRVPRHRRDHRSLRRPRQVRLPDGAARQAGCADAGRVGCDVCRRRSRAADRLPHAAGDPPVGPRERAQSPRVAARQVRAEARCGRSCRRVRNRCHGKSRRT